MFYKYLKLIVFSTLLLQASPKAFNSLGDELEAFQKDCITYQKISSLPTKIKKQCDVFNSKLKSAFKVGYKLDPYIDSDNINEKKSNKYLGLLRKLDKSKENILDLIYSEVKKARKQNNIKYYSQLIANNKIKLYSSDYEFMEKNKDIFAKNKRYISHMSYLKSLEESKKPILVTKKQVVENSQIDKVLKLRDEAIQAVQAMQPPRSSLLSKVDLITSSGYLQDDVLKITFFYKNRSIDKQLFWKNDVATITCNAYGNAGDWLKPSKGSLIGQISNKRVTRAFQDIYIDIRKTAFKRGILECSINIHGRIFKVTDTFLIK